MFIFQASAQKKEPSWKDFQLQLLEKAKTRADVQVVIDSLKAKYGDEPLKNLRALQKAMDRDNQAAVSTFKRLAKNDISGLKEEKPPAPEKKEKKAEGFVKKKEEKAAASPAEEKKAEKIDLKKAQLLPLDYFTWLQGWGNTFMPDASGKSYFRTVEDARKWDKEGRGRYNAVASAALDQMAASGWVQAGWKEAMKNGTLSLDASQTAVFKSLFAIGIVQDIAHMQAAAGELKTMDGRPHSLIEATGLFWSGEHSEVANSGMNLQTAKSKTWWGRIFAEATKGTELEAKAEKKAGQEDWPKKQPGGLPQPPEQQKIVPDSGAPAPALKTGEEANTPATKTGVKVKYYASMDEIGKEVKNRFYTLEGGKFSIRPEVLSQATKPVNDELSALLRQRQSEGKPGLTREELESVFARHEPKRVAPAATTTPAGGKFQFQEEMERAQKKAGQTKAEKREVTAEKPEEIAVKKKKEEEAARKPDVVVKVGGEEEETARVTRYEWFNKAFSADDGLAKAYGGLNERQKKELASRLSGYIGNGTLTEKNFSANDVLLELNDVKEKVR